MKVVQAFISALHRDERERRYEDALRLIAGDRCETFTRGRCSDPHSGRTRGARYGAEAWCDACIAHDALTGGSR